MTTLGLAIFDDAAGHFGPLTDTRAVFELRTGALTTLQRIEQRLGANAANLDVPPRLRAVVAERHNSCAINTPPAGLTRLVNGRWLGLDAADRVAALEPGQALLQRDGQLVAACLDEPRQIESLRAGDLAGIHVQQSDDTLLVERPWHLLDALDAALRADLAHTHVPQARPEHWPGLTVAGSHALHIDPSVQMLGPVAVDARHGPVVIERDTLIHGFAAIQGPCYVGPGCELGAHVTLRRLTSLGPRCRLAGELAVTIIQEHTNKAHHGYLGCAIVGSGCNLGAGTDVSNLKNTLGEVRVQLAPDAPAEPTGRARQGPILGDHVRTAIGTRLMTGSVIGTGCMIAVSGYAPKCAARFGFYTDAGRAEHDLQALLITIERMRKTPATDAERKLLHALCAQVA